MIILAAVAAGGYCICNVVGDNILTNWSQCLLFESQNKIEWLEKPHIDGYFLVMSGQVKDGAQVHDPHTQYGDSFRAAFTLNETSGEELDVVASIWPQNMASLLDNADGSAIFATTTYRGVSTYSDFYIRVELPRHIMRALQRGTRLAAVVWEQDPQLVEPLGAECIEE